MKNKSNQNEKIRSRGGQMYLKIPIYQSKNLVKCLMNSHIELDKKSSEIGDEKEKQSGLQEKSIPIQEITAIGQPSFIQQPFEQPILNNPCSNSYCHQMPLMLQPLQSCHHQPYNYYPSPLMLQPNPQPFCYYPSPLMPQQSCHPQPCIFYPSPPMYMGQRPMSYYKHYVPKLSTPAVKNTKVAKSQLTNSNPYISPWSISEANLPRGTSIPQWEPSMQERIITQQNIHVNNLSGGCTAIASNSLCPPFQFKKNLSNGRNTKASDIVSSIKIISETTTSCNKNYVILPRTKSPSERESIYNMLQDRNCSTRNSQEIVFENNFLQPQQPSNVTETEIRATSPLVSQLLGVEEQVESIDNPEAISNPEMDILTLTYEDDKAILNSENETNEIANCELNDSENLVASFTESIEDMERYCMQAIEEMIPTLQEDELGMDIMDMDMEQNENQFYESEKQTIIKEHSYASITDDSTSISELDILIPKNMHFDDNLSEPDPSIYQMASGTSGKQQYLDKAVEKSSDLAVKTPMNTVHRAIHSDFLLNWGSTQNMNKKIGKSKSPFVLSKKTFTSTEIPIRGIGKLPVLDLSNSKIPIIALDYHAAKVVQSKIRQTENKKKKTEKNCTNLTKYCHVSIKRLDHNDLQQKTKNRVTTTKRQPKASSSPSTISSIVSPTDPRKKTETKKHKKNTKGLTEEYCRVLIKRLDHNDLQQKTKNLVTSNKKVDKPTVGKGKKGQIQPKTSSSPSTISSVVGSTDLRKEAKTKKNTKGSKGLEKSQHIHERNNILTNTISSEPVLSSPPAPIKTTEERLSENVTSGTSQHALAEEDDILDIFPEDEDLMSWGQPDQHGKNVAKVRYRKL